MTRKIKEIAADIRNEWGKVGKGVSPYAKPYLDAMLTLDTIDDYYYCDSAHSIVCYFLGNAGSFRGENAKRLKAELKKLAGLK